MVQHIDAVYEDGVLKPLEPLNLSEHQRVRVSVVSQVQDLSQSVAAQRQAMDDLDAELTGAPDVSPADGFSAVDHDRLLYERPA